MLKAHSVMFAALEVEVIVYNDSPFRISNARFLLSYV